MSFLDDLLLFDTSSHASVPTVPLALDDAIFDGFDLSLAPGGGAAPIEDEAQESLSSLLADWTDSDSWELASDSCGSAVGSPPPPQNAALEQDTSDHKKRKVLGSTGTQPVTTAASVTPAAPLKRPRKHNRLEIIKLRDEVEELQSRLSKLQKVRRVTADCQQGMDTASSSHVKVSVAVAAQYALRQEAKKRSELLDSSAYTLSLPRSVWLDLAVEQYSELQLAEQTNRRLRDAVDRHMKVYAAFQALVTSTPRTEDMELLSSAETKCCERHDPLQPTLPSLFASVMTQLSETDAILASISRLNDISSVFHSCATKQCAVRGPTFELTTNTPVTGHYEQFARTLWDRITECSAQQIIPLPSTSTRLKRVQVTLENADGCVQLTGMVVIRKFQESDRVVLTLAATYAVEGSDLVFRETGWVITSAGDASSVPEYLPSWARPSSRVLMQTFYRLSSERQDAQSATGSVPFAQTPDKDTKFLQEFVIQALGERVREHKVELQTSLLSVSPEVGFSKMDFIDCPLIDSPCS